MTERILTAEKKAELAAYIRRIACGVVSTVDKSGAPEAAFVFLAVTPGLEIVFETLNTARKFRNVARDPRVALVIGWEDDTSLQIEGLAGEPDEFALEELKPVYYETCPQNRGHLGWPGLTYLRVKPRWLRFSNYGARWRVEEFTL
ncbi:MAG TPA: pyridoxamine 5'-phosphate oxidase family protein [Rhizomicrobium sp.]|nr:pyridoxamine 5'-phosphate oxidase family protein [Rhizomicrobium sp.]